MHMKKFLILLVCSVAVVLKATAAFNLTATKAEITDVTVDKNNFFVLVTAHTSSGEYEVAFDVWPSKHSAIGSFSASDGTIGYVSSFVHKTKANGSAANLWYYPEENAAISLDIADNGNGTCTLSGSIQATRSGTTYTYDISAFDFAYSEGDTPEPPAEDPFRFEPTEPTTVNFIADVINFREREGYIEVTLNEMENETYDWIELRLLSDELAMPAGAYVIEDSGSKGTLTASKGYLGGTKGDDPCYVAIRGNKEDWGQYTPYYLESGNLTVSYNAKGDTIIITGQAFSHNGSTVNVNARGYNMLYVDDTPPEPEDVTLGIDSVVITYMSNLSDSANNRFVYVFNFSKADDYPTVLVDVLLSKPMELVAGTYTLADESLSGLQLAQNQSDFEANLFAGGAYDFVSATLILAEENGSWKYTMEMNDAIGSHYRFEFIQDPHIILWPQPEVPVEEQPYTAESKEQTIQTMVLDTLIWKDETVAKDGIIDIIMTRKEADTDGMRPYVHLGMYSDVTRPAAGTYPVNGSEADGSFSASLGQYGSTLIPCYAAFVNEYGMTSQIWFIVSGSVTLSYAAEQPVVSGEGISYYGSTIRFEYQPKTEGIEKVQRDNVQGTKILRDGQLYLMYEGKMYDVQGRVMIDAVMLP